jgi:transcriptional regulator with XRE-family HTH domain
VAKNYGNQRPKVDPPVVPLPALRKSHGLTLGDVLTRIEENRGRRYTPGALSAVENGHRGASQQFLEDIAEVYGLEPHDLWTGYAPRNQRNAEDAA